MCNEDFVFILECYTKGNASYKGCVCMYLPQGMRHTKITMIRHPVLHNFASNTDFIGILYKKMCSNMPASVLQDLQNYALRITMWC